MRSAFVVKHLCSRSRKLIPAHTFVETAGCCLVCGAVTLCWTKELFLAYQRARHLNHIFLKSPARKRQSAHMHPVEADAGPSVLGLPPTLMCLDVSNRNPKIMAVRIYKHTAEKGIQNIKMFVTGFKQVLKKRIFLRCAQIFSLHFKFSKGVLYMFDKC